MSSSRIKGPPSGRMSKLSLADKPQIVPKPNKRRGRKVSKPKDSAAGSSSHGNMVKEPEAATYPGNDEDLAKLRAQRDWWNATGIAYFNPMEIRDPGAEPLVPQGPTTCPHQGNKNPFSIIFCKADCNRAAPAGGFRYAGRFDVNSSSPGKDERKAGKDFGRATRVRFPVRKGVFADPPGTF